MAVRPGGSNTGSAQVGAGGTAVETVRLDDLWPSLGYERLDFMKMDVEGHEVRALEGAREVIRRHRPLLLVEIDPPRLQECGSSPDALIQLLRALGYRLLQGKRRALEPFVEASSRALVNVFCIHEGA
jgi:hypothetical protein